MRTTSQVLRGEYLRLIQTQGFLLSIGVGLALLTGSLDPNYASNTYADASQSNFVRDLLLDRLPVVNTSLVLNEGMVAFAVAVGVMAARFPARLPFLLKSAALFVTARAVFISLTHLAVPPQRVLKRAFHLTGRYRHGEKRRQPLIAWMSWVTLLGLYGDRASRKRGML
jgi:hypothetical protein